MKGIEILESHPKSATVLKQWYLEKMLEGLKNENLPEDFKEYVRQQDVNNEGVASIIDISPRGLFDVFDSHKIYVETVIDTGANFWWKIGEQQSSIGYESRINCDKAAIVEAFKLLEAKL